MNGIWEKIGRRKVAVAILLVGMIAFSVAYAFVQTRVGFAVLTTPPPDIPGPYYIAAELKIYGPPVNLATIKSKMSGSYASDYSYVKWGTDPFYKVFADNTFQEVFYGQMVDIMDRLSYSFQIENDLVNTYNTLKNTGAIDPESQAGTRLYFGNMPGLFIVVSGLSQSPSTLNTITSYWYAAQGSSKDYYYGGNWQVKLNGTICLNVPYYSPVINATGYGPNWSTWTISRIDGGTTFSGVFYFKDLSYFTTDMPTSNHRMYTVIDSPGTGYVTKSLYPSSPKAGSTFTVTVRFDTPTANNANITDYYPNVFTWPGGQVTLKRFKIGVGEVASTTVSVTPVPEFANMKFTINYNQATTVLQSVAGDEYLTMDYSLRAPASAGEYTLPAATIKYTIPIP